MDSKHLFAPHYTPTAKRPLLGMTVLVVEDSRFVCDGLRLMCLHSGARVRRADSLKSARRHLRVYRPSIAVIDIGLPDGSGLELIRDLAQQRPRIGALLGISGDETGALLARQAGADEFLSKPLKSLSEFQESVLKHMPEKMRPSGPRSLNEIVIEPDPTTYIDDLQHVSNLLEDSKTDPQILDYLTQFTDSLAHAADDKPLIKAIDDIRKSRNAGGDIDAAIKRLGALISHTSEMVAAV